jgi:hypothetical protein
MQGNLKIKAVVTDRKATRYGAFSVGGRVDAHHIENADNAGFCAASGLEVSLTDCPSNPQASSRGVTASCVACGRIPSIAKTAIDTLHSDVVRGDRRSEPRAHFAAASCNMERMHAAASPCGAPSDTAAVTIRVPRSSCTK